MAYLLQIIFVLAFFFQSPEPGFGQDDECPNFKVYNYGVEKEAAILIVKEINFARDCLNNGSWSNMPRPKHLKRIKYSRKLAKLAQERADTCEVHSQPVFFEEVRLGRTIFISKSSKLQATFESSWKDAINYWVSMYKYFKYPNITKSLGALYTQLIDERTTKVGCGYKCFRDDEDDTHPYLKYYVCLFDSIVRLNKPPFEADESD